MSRYKQEDYEEDDEYYEYEEEARLPREYRPISAWGYFGYTLLFALPLIGLICMIIFSLDDSNINRRNFARSHFCVIAVVIVFILLWIILVSCLGVGFTTGY